MPPVVKPLSQLVSEHRQLTLVAAQYRRLLIHHDNPDIARACFQETTQILETKTEPADWEPNYFQQQYAYFASTVPEIGKYTHDYVSCFDTLEFQASWLVLKSRMDTLLFKALNHAQRMRDFNFKLFQEQDKWGFYGARIAALHQLVQLGLIHITTYVPRELLPKL